MNEQGGAVLNLYHVVCHTDLGWDSYSSFVCAAQSEAHARDMHPTGENGMWEEYDQGGWIKRDEVGKLYVFLIGTAAPHMTGGVIVASFHAG